MREDLPKVSPYRGQSRGLVHSWGSLGKALQTLLCQGSHQLLPLEPLPEKSAERILGSGEEGRKEAACTLDAAADTAL